MKFLKFLALFEIGNEGNISDLRNWVWNRTERVRWLSMRPKDDWLAVAQDEAVKVVVVDVASAGTATAWDVVSKVERPVIAVHPDRTLLQPLADRFSTEMIPISGDWQNASGRLEDLLRRVGIPVFPLIHTRFDRNDLSLLHTLNQLAGVEHEPNQGHPMIAQWLKLAIAKYFGTDRQTIRLSPVSGGWSGTPILEVSIDGAVYYLKFFDTIDQLSQECEAYQLARDKWLRDLAVEVQFIDELPTNTTGLAEAFPVDSRKFPLCLRSASDNSTERTTFQELYERGDYPAISQAFTSIIGALRQPDAAPIPIGPLQNPGHQVNLASGQTFFLNDRDRQSVVLDNLHDLRRTLHQLCPAWYGLEDHIRNLITDECPQWLKGDTPVQRGHVHGDLNTRNCLCAKGNPADIRFIDLGGYCPEGFLVHDLSMLEASIKWGAMGSEIEPGYRFGDMDTQLLRDAGRTETFAIEAGLALSQEAFFATLPAERRNTGNALTRAYSLVALIRARAREVSFPGDPQGKHYFAALLGWNLRWLKAPHVRRVKKVLALYSSALILEKFSAIEAASSRRPSRRKLASSPNQVA